MGNCSSSSREDDDITSEVEFSENPERIEFVQHSFRDFSRKSLVSLSSIQKTVISGGRSSSFLERLTHSAHGNNSFYRLSAVITVIPHAQIYNLKIILFQELEKNEFEPLYQAANPGFILPADSSELALGESFDCGTYDTSFTSVDVTCDTFISHSASAKILYLFMVDYDHEVLSKAKIILKIRDAKPNATNRIDIAAKSMFERENRRVQLDQVIDDEGTPSTSQPREGDKFTAGIFDKAAVTKTYDALLRIRRPPLNFLLANDGTFLSYRIYEPPKEAPQAIIICVTQNNIFMDVFAAKISKSFPVRVYIGELRGFGYSGGERGAASSKEVIWKDVNSFIKHAKYHAPGLPVVLSGHFYNAGVLLNFASWDEHLPVAGYILMSPNLGIEASETWRKGMFDEIVQKKAVQPYLKNITIAKLTNGVFKGQKMAIKYNFPDEVYTVNPMVVDVIKVNSFLSAYPPNPRLQISNMDRPIRILVGESDEFIDPESLCRYIESCMNPICEIDVIPGETGQITILESAVPYVKTWLEKQLQDFRTSVPKNETTEQMVQKPIYLESLITDGLGDLQLAASLKRIQDEPMRHQVPSYQYLEAYDGIRLAYQCYRPANYSSVLIFWVDALLSDFIMDLSTQANIMIYRFDVRGTGQSELGKPSKKALLKDIRFSVTFCKKNFPGFVIFLGGKLLTASLLLNYSSWRRADHPNAYVFIDPLSRPAMMNDPFCLPPSERLFGFQISEHGAIFKKREPAFFNSAYAHRPFRSNFLKATLCGDLAGQLLRLNVTFGLWCSKENPWIRTNGIIYSVCALSNAPMHTTEVVTGLHAYDDFEPFITSFKAWAERVSTSLNPQPNRALFKKSRPSDFEKIELIGKGTFGHVWLVRHKATEKFYALKILNKTEVASSGLVEQTIRERDILQQTSNPFIVPYVGSFQDSSNLYLLMEFLVGGELYTLLKLNGKLTVSMARFYAAEILMALSALHDRRICYRDLKPENILLDALGHVRLIDFGLSRTLSTSSNTCTTFCGSPFYMAPEMISKKQYGLSVDIWSFGVVLFELLSGTLPFNGRSANEIYRKIVYGKIVWPEQLDPDARDLIEKLLVREPIKRLGAFSLAPNGTAQPNSSRNSTTPFEPPPVEALEFDGHAATALKQPILASRYNAIMRHKFFKGIDWDLIYTRASLPPFQPAVSSDGDTSNFIKYALTDTLKSEPFDTTKGDPFVKF